MMIVLSPAKKLDFETPLIFAEHTQPGFLDQSELLIERLREFSPLELGRLMGVSDQLAVLNVMRYAQWRRPFTLENARQALLAFNGDVYEGLDAASLAPESFQFAQSHLRILSGLYGVLRPLDLIQPYRLEMGTRLANSRGKDLYAFWGERVVDALNQAMDEIKAPALVNLASEEYFKSVCTAKLKVPVIQPVFEDWSGDERSGKFKVVSFYAKRARGMMARFALSNGLQQPQDLKDFADGGYAFAENASSGMRWVFRRRLNKPK